MPLTEGQLRSKRDEFWDTAPAFDGRKEIWDALRAATIAAEALDFQLSQAILDGANISVPNSQPVNLVHCPLSQYLLDTINNKLVLCIVCPAHHNIPLNSCIIELRNPIKTRRIKKEKEKRK